MTPSLALSKETPGENNVHIAGAINRYRRLGEATHGLRDYQVGSIRAIARQLTQPMYSQLEFNRPPENPDHDLIKTVEGGLICLPPGMGKTHVIGAMIQAVNPTPETPIIVSTPYKFLNSQMKRDLVKMGISEGDIGVYDSDRNAFEKKRALTNCKVIITSCQSIGQVISKLDKQGKFSPLIMPDEVDFWAVGKQTSQIIKRQRPHSVILGFTATEGGACKELFENQAPLYHKTYVESIVNNNLCDGVRTHVTDVTIDDEWAKRLQALEKSGKEEADFKKADQEHFSQNDATLNAALYNHFTHVDPDIGAIYKHRAFFFVHGVEAADKGAAEFNRLAGEIGLAGQVRAASITHKTDKNVAKQMMDDFKAGKITALFSDRILSRGVDVSDGAIVHNLRMSKKKSVVTQMLGRVTRKEGKDFEQTYGHHKVAVAFNYRLEGTNPVLFGELLEGKPEVYADNYHAKEAQHEEKAEALPALPASFSESVRRTAKFYTKTEEVAELISSARAVRDGLSDKLPGLYNKFEYATKLHVGMENPVFLELWNSLQRRYRDDPSAKVILDNQEIECGYFRVPRRGKEFCIHEKHLDLLAAHVDAAMEQYKPMAYFFDALEGPGMEDAIRARWKILADEYATSGESLKTDAEGAVHINGRPYFARLPVFGALPEDLKLDVKATKALQREIGTALPPQASAEPTKVREFRDKDSFASELGPKSNRLYLKYLWDKLERITRKQGDNTVTMEGNLVQCRLNEGQNPPAFYVATGTPMGLKSELSRAGNKFVSLHDVIQRKTGERGIWDEGFSPFVEEIYHQYWERLKEKGLDNVARTADGVEEKVRLNEDFIQDITIGGKTFPVYIYDSGTIHIQEKMVKELPLKSMKLCCKNDVARVFGITDREKLTEFFGVIRRLYEQQAKKRKGSDDACNISVGGETILAFWEDHGPKEDAKYTRIDMLDKGKLARILAKEGIITKESAQSFQKAPVEPEGFAAKTGKRGRPRKNPLDPDEILRTKNGRIPGL